MADKKAGTGSKSVATIVGLILGVIALLTSFMPFINNFSFIFAVFGLAFAIVGLMGVLRGKKAGKGVAIVSVVVNVLAIAIVMGTQSMYSAAIDEASKGTVSTADGSAASAATTASDNASVQAEPADKYTIEGEELSGDAYSCKVTGTFTNTSGSELGYVQVSYNLFDADGNQVGTALANTSNLADGGTWKFEAFGTKGTDEVASFRLGEVTGF